MTRFIILAALTLGSAALAQTSTPEFSPPPMVPATPPPMPPPEPNTPAVTPPGTPPPPATVPPPSYVPGQQQSSGYQYSPYGQPQQQQKPGPEIGLMVSESLFGMLTAAGVTVLPYFLLFGNGTLTGDPTISSIIFILIFSAVPLAVAQTQVSLANGSRYYLAETWPAALAGLAAQAGVLALFYATGWLPTPQVSGGLPNGGSVPLLLIGAIGVVPLIQMIVINLTKQPKFKPYAMNFKPGEGFSLGVPTPTPIVAQTSAGTSYGVSLSLLHGTW